MSKAELIAGAFDLQRRERLCNMEGCGRVPAMKVTLYEENMITRGSKALATVYLCREHHMSRMPGFMTEINGLRETGRIVESRVQDIGFRTH